MRCWVLPPHEEAGVVEMNAMEEAWAKVMVPGCNGYNARCFVFENGPEETDVEAVRASFERALSAYPALAGRWSDKGVEVRGGALFIAVRAKGAYLPRDRNCYGTLRNLAYYPSSAEVLKGDGPLASVKLTFFDDAAVLALAASHAVCDGATTWNFIEAWCKESKEQFPRSTLSHFLLTDDIYEELFFKYYGTKRPRRPNDLLFRRSYFILPIVERLWRWFGTSFFGERISLEVSNVELASLKKRAKALSTQDALLCHVAKALARNVKKPRVSAKIFLVYDPRTMVGLPANQAAGCGFLDFAVVLEDLNNRDVVDLAKDMRAQLDAAKAVAKDLYSLLLTAFQRGEGFDATFCMRQGILSSKSAATQKQDYDVQFCLNNQSKRRLPQFPGLPRPASTCLCENAICALPTTDGIVLHLLLASVKPSLSDPSTRGAFIRDVMIFD